MLLVNGCDFLRVPMPNGHKANPAWHSPVKQNNMQIEKIMEGMLRRFNETKYRQFTRIIQFYENGSLVAKINVQ